eukprot:m.42718 g.42718  ORF g.42718 m.42718 type:complete len:338 (-) comp5739_c0_seq1:2501-3514(-)
MLELSLVVIVIVVVVVIVRACIARQRLLVRGPRVRPVRLAQPRGQPRRAARRGRPQHGRAAPHALDAAGQQRADLAVGRLLRARRDKVRDPAKLAARDAAAAQADRTAQGHELGVRAHQHRAADAQRVEVHRQRSLVLLERLEHDREVPARDPDILMVCTEGRALDVQRALVQRQRLAVALPVVEDVGHVVEGLGVVCVVGPEPPLEDVDNTSVELKGLHVAALQAVEVGQRVDRTSKVGVAAAQTLLELAHSLAAELDCLLRVALRAQQQRKVVVCVGDLAVLSAQRHLLHVQRALVQVAGRVQLAVGLAEGGQTGQGARNVGMQSRVAQHRVFDQ